MLETVVCNLCGAQDTRILTRVQISPITELSNLVKCRRCGLTYINPRHPAGFEKTFYRDSYHEVQEPEVWNEYRMPFFRTMLKKINYYGWPIGKILLDMGCGKGFFLDAARQAGWTVKGVEISRSAVAYGRKELGLDIVEGDLKGANLPDNHFSVVTVWNVLDQYFEPLGMARQICQVMKKDGRVFLRISNITFHLWLHRMFQCLRRVFPYIKGKSEPTVFHIYMFSPATITRLLNRAGFKNVRVTNSPLSPQVAAVSNLTGSRFNYWIGLLAFGMAQLFFWLSLKRLVIGPSLLVIAQKTE